MPKITPADFDSLIHDDLPWAEQMGMRTDRIGRGSAVLRLPFAPSSLRPGGTISGPSMMALADACMYAAVLGAIGMIKMTVTVGFNINFMYRPAPADLLAEARVLKLGKRLAVVEVSIHCEGHAEPVAHATGTYSIPPNPPS